MSLSLCYEIINRDRFFCSAFGAGPLESPLSTSGKIRCGCIVPGTALLYGVVWGPQRKALLMKHLFLASSPFSLFLFCPSLHQVISLLLSLSLSFFHPSLSSPDLSSALPFHFFNNINYLKCPAYPSKKVLDFASVLNTQLEQKEKNRKERRKKTLEGDGGPHTERDDGNRQ